MPVRGIGMSVIQQHVNQCDHLGNMRSGAWLDVRWRDSQCVHVFLVGLAETLSNDIDGLTTFQGSGIDLVVDIGNVSCIGDLRIAVLEKGHEHIEDNGGAGVADVGEVINGRSADIHQHRVRVGSPQGLLALGQAVVKLNLRCVGHA